MFAVTACTVSAVLVLQCWSVAAVDSNNGPPVVYNATLVMENCLENNNITLGEIKTVLSDLTLKTQAQKCVVGCFLRKSYVLVNNGSVVERAHISVDKTALNSSTNFWDRTAAEFGYAVSQGIADGIALVMEQIKNVVYTCVKRAESVTDECTLPGIVWNCFEKNINSTMPSRRKRNASLKFRGILTQNILKLI